MKGIKYILFVLIAGVVFSGCKSGLFMPTAGSVKKKLQGKWQKYTFNETPTVDNPDGLWETWEFNGDNIYMETNWSNDAQTLRDIAAAPCKCVRDTLPFEIKSSLVKASMEILTDFQGRLYQGKWAITTLKSKKGIMALTSKEGSQQLLEFAKLD